MLEIVSDIEKKIKELEALIKLQGEEIEKYRIDLTRIKEKLAEPLRR
jgi:peptidoglycan hydrolase CwlO-like protein